MQIEGVPISNPDRPLWDDPPIAKLGLARYMAAVAPWMVPHVAGRPLTLVRADGPIRAGTTFMRHGRAWGPAPLRRVTIREKTKLGEYLVVDDAAGLVALAQMGVVEVHTWNTRAGDVERPDRVVFDLDPGDDVGWREVVAAARVVRDALAALRLESWVKTTGGRGLHVVAPLVAERPWDECLAFARGLAETLAASAPERFTVRYARQGRERQILVDYLRNNRTNTSVAACSPRARPGAPVSWPLGWGELGRSRKPPTVVDAVRRMRRRRRDPWEGYFRARQRLDDRVMRAVAR